MDMSGRIPVVEEAIFTSRERKRAAPAFARLRLRLVPCHSQDFGLAPVVAFRSAESHDEFTEVPKLSLGTSAGRYTEIPTICLGISVFSGLDRKSTRLNSSH